MAESCTTPSHVLDFVSLPYQPASGGGALVSIPNHFTAALFSIPACTVPAARKTAVCGAIRSSAAGEQCGSKNASDPIKPKSRFPFGTSLTFWATLSSTCLQLGAHPPKSMFVTVGRLLTL